MKIIDVLGKPCPIPVIESKKALADQNTDGILVTVDNIVAVQNLEKMANGYGYSFSYTAKGKNFFEVAIGKTEKILPKNHYEDCELKESKASGSLVVVISKDTMGEGSDELGKILIKGFIYSLTELPTPPTSVIFLNSGAYLTSVNANTINDIKKLEQKGSEILTCGTCIDYYGLQDKLAVGSITNMYGITERMAAADSIINI